MFRLNVVSTQKIHGGCLKITSADTELVFLKNLPIFVVFFRGLVFVYSETLANLLLFSPSQRRFVTNSARVFTPGKKDSIAHSIVGVIVGWVVISLISKIWMFIRSGRGKNYKKKHVRKLKNCFTHYDGKHFFNFV